MEKASEDFITEIVKNESVNHFSLFNSEISIAKTSEYNQSNLESATTIQAKFPSQKRNVLYSFIILICFLILAGYVENLFYFISLFGGITLALIFILIAVIYITVFSYFWKGIVLDSSGIQIDEQKILWKDVNETIILRKSSISDSSYYLLVTYSNNCHYILRSLTFLITNNESRTKGLHRLAQSIEAFKEKSKV